MMTKIIYALALASIFTLSSIPLNADIIQGNISKEVVCFYEWETEQAYQGSKSLCLTPEDVRTIVSEKGKMYTLEPAEGSNSSLAAFLSSNVLLKKLVAVVGTIEKDSPVDSIKVEKLMIE